MAKLCPRGKAAAKRKFKVYPSAYANMYASGVCSGKITPGGKKRVKKAEGGSVLSKLKKSDPDKKLRQKGNLPPLKKIAKGCGKVMGNRRKKTQYV